MNEDHPEYNRSFDQLNEDYIKLVKDYDSLALRLKETLVLLHNTWEALKNTRYSGEQCTVDNFGLECIEAVESVLNKNATIIELKDTIDILKML